METMQTQVPSDCTVECFETPKTLALHLGWRLGIGLEGTAQGKALWHWGDNGAFKAYMVIYPRQRSGLVMFTNSENGLEIAGNIAKAGLGSAQPALTWILHNPS